MVSAPPFRHNDREEDFMDVAVVTRRLTADGKNASSYESQDSLRTALTVTVRAGDVVLIMSNGGFGGIHEWLLGHLEQRTA